MLTFFSISSAFVLVTCKFEVLWDYKACIVNGATEDNHSIDSRTNFEISNTWVIDTSSNTRDNADIKRLDIKNSDITDINNEIFSVFTNLKRLSISEANFIVNNLKPEFLKGAAKLEKLELNNNNLTFLVYKNFRETPKLKYLSLSNNKIFKVEDSAFKGLEKLKTLDLSANQLELIKSETFCGAENLNALYLFDNKIKMIESGSFDNFKKLSWLKLGGNICINRYFYQFLGKEDGEEIYKACQSELNNLVTDTTAPTVTKSEAMSTSSSVKIDVTEPTTIKIINPSSASSSLLALFTTQKTPENLDIKLSIDDNELEVVKAKLQAANYKIAELEEKMLVLTNKLKIGDNSLIKKINDQITFKN